jgi:protein-L-isoaspartate(D-aspartate) O-methyltransferase
LQLAEIQPSDLVLDIGPGTGYSTAIIAKLAESVVSVEENNELCESSGQTLIELGVTNAAVICGEHVKGLANEAPFDVIVINGQVEEIPQTLINQLADGGRLVAVIGSKNLGRATVIKKQDEKLSTSTGFDASAPLLDGFQTSEKGFQF